MVAKRPSAQASARWLSPDSVSIDHARLDRSDKEWLSDVRRLTLWAVGVPEGLLASMPKLEWLDIRGGSGTSVDYIGECTNLSYLQVNQVRGLRDLSFLDGMRTIRFLSLYGLPRVQQLPSLAPLIHLQRLELGSMKGLSGLAPALEAPALTELVLIKNVTLSPGDPDAITDHPMLHRFTWFAEDVPKKTWAPVVERVGLPQAPILQPHEWFELNS